MHSLLTVFHRYVGLALAGFLFLAGITGSVIAFYQELDEGLNPQLYLAPSRGEALGIDALVERVERAEPRAQVSGFDLERTPGRAVVVRVEPQAGTAERAALAFDELFVDPVDGAILGRRLWGECCLSRERFVPFLYSLHYSLHLPERAGVIVMGGVALVWIVDCFVALALTWPRGGQGLQRWGRAFRIERGASRYRLFHDIHQASGLWLWLLLLMIAISGVALNLQEEVFRPVVGSFSRLAPTPIEDAQRLGLTRGERALSFAEAIERARAVAAERGWPTDATYAFRDSELGAYGIGVARAGEDPEVGMGASWIYLSDHEGTFISAQLTGEGGAGDVFSQLQFPLHSGHLFGLPGRIAISLLGLATAVLSATGVYIWAVKRAARVAATRARRPEALAGSILRDDSR